ncbi:MAG: type II secretion system protein J [Bacteriovoracia bacterium]
MKGLVKSVQSGFSLMEMVVTLALVSFLGLLVIGFYDYSTTQTNIQVESVHTMIEKLGASKVISNDLSGALPSFNYINLEDDLDPSNPRPFFVLAKNEYCQGGSSTRCQRQFKLEIPEGKTFSKPFFLITVKGFRNELINFPRSIEKDVFTSGPPYTYKGLNDPSKPETNISKGSFPESPWIKGRMMMLTSNEQFFDCFNKVHSVQDSTSCTLTCATSGACNYVAKRELKMLGVVKEDEKDLNFYAVAKHPNLLKNKYYLCNINDKLGCENHVDLTAGIKSSQELFEKMPFSPGLNNGAFLTPVELVRYHLEKPSPTSRDDEIRLFRSVAIVSGTSLSFQRAHILMTGIKSFVFSRVNVSNPTIEYKLNRIKQVRR